MRYALISDIHANLSALEGVLRATGAPGCVLQITSALMPQTAA